MPVKKVTSDKKQVTSKITSTVKAKQTSKTEKVEAKIAMTKPVAKKTVNLTVPVYTLLGKESGTMSLPKEIFGQKASKSLLAQVVRVYTTNQKNFTGKTKTRGEIEASKAKIYRQKGTGRARHGAISAPIFVGGGIVFGPRPRNVRLELPKKMKKAALLAALTDKAQDSGVFGLSGLEKATGKTKEMAILTKALKLKTALIVTGEKQDNVVRAVSNIHGIDVLPVNLINAFEVLKHQTLLLTKEAVEKLEAGKNADVIKTEKTLAEEQLPVKITTPRTGKSDGRKAVKA